MCDSSFSLRIFDREQDTLVTERKLPHWAQAHTLSFITWRTWDSIPQPVLRQWLQERREWLDKHGIDARSSNWQHDLERLSRTLQGEFHRTFADRWHAELDRGHGACVLRSSDYAQIVGDSLLHFDGQRYLVTDFIIMPNHVHLLAGFESETIMLAQCENWKHFTATQINRKLQRTGRFWQPDVFDHLVRSVEQFDYLRNYIAKNPKVAGLRPGQYLHYTKDLS